MSDQASGPPESPLIPGGAADGLRPDVPPLVRATRRDVPRQVLTWLVMVLIVASLLIAVFSILSDDAASAPSSSVGGDSLAHVHVV